MVLFRSYYDLIQILEDYCTHFLISSFKILLRSYSDCIKILLRSYLDCIKSDLIMVLFRSHSDIILSGSY